MYLKCLVMMTVLKTVSYSYADNAKNADQNFKTSKQQEN